MAESNDETTEETTGAEIAPDAPEATPAPEAEAEAAAAPTEADDSRPASESDEAPDAAATETAEEESGEPVAAAQPPAEPEVVLPPKERRAAARAAKAAKTPARAERSGEDRHADRVTARSKKAAERRAGRVKARAKASHDGPATTEPREHPTGTQKVRQGVVVSDKADKTITVRIDVARRHRRYKKIVRTSNTLHAHDETNDAHIGDTVIVREARPLSRTKRWRLLEVIEKAR